MKILKIGLFLSVCFLIPKSIIACSCKSMSFCEFYSQDYVKIAFKGVVINRKDYGNDNHVMYLKVLEKFREEQAFSDTIKIYGGTNGANCDLDVLSRFEFRDTIIGAIAQWSFSTLIINPDSLSENLTEVNPGICGIRIIRLKSNIVKGWIDDEIYEYPTDLFEAGIQTCDFEKSVIQNVLCESDDFYISPNPATTSFIELRGNFWRLEIERVRVFSPSGELLDDLAGLRGFSRVEIQSEKFIPGLNILEIHCEGRVFLKKVLMRI